MFRVKMVELVSLKMHSTMLVTVHLASMAPIANWTSMRTAVKVKLNPAKMFVGLHQFSLLRKVSVNLAPPSNNYI